MRQYSFCICALSKYLLDSCARLLRSVAADGCVSMVVFILQSYVSLVQVNQCLCQIAAKQNLLCAMLSESGRRMFEFVSLASTALRLLHFLRICSKPQRVLQDNFVPNCSKSFKFRARLK